MDVNDFTNPIVSQACLARFAGENTVVCKRNDAGVNASIEKSRGVNGRQYLSREEE